MAKGPLVEVGGAPGEQDSHKCFSELTIAVCGVYRSIVIYGGTQELESKSCQLILYHLNVRWES